VSCGYSPSSSTQTSGLKYRAFITNGVSAGTGLAGVYIVDAQNDVRANVAAISAGNTPGMMVLTPNRAQTLVFSGNGTQFSDNALTFINNAGESVSGEVTLPGSTESIVVSPDGSAAYAAVPTAKVVGQSPGVVKAISTSRGTTGEVDVPGVRYLSINNGGNRILGFSNDSDSVAVITPTNIGTGNAVTLIGGFDRPVAAFFTSDDSTAYVINCGAECGGTQASVQKVDFTVTQCLPTGVCPAVPVPAATVAVINNSTLYLAGTPLPASPCTGQTTQATTCGLLTIFDLSSMTVTNSTPIVITDGYHNRMALGADGQLFIGAHTCTEISTTAETRGCLSIYDTNNLPGAVVIPPANGDVTGIEPISKREVVYVAQGGSLRIYDTTTDALEHNPNNPDNPGQIFGLVGQFIDVKVVDF
jgi:hypothetical protein